MHGKEWRAIRGCQDPQLARANCGRQDPQLARANCGCRAIHSQAIPSRPRSTAGPEQLGLRGGLAGTLAIRAVDGSECQLVGGEANGDIVVAKPRNAQDDGVMA